MSAGTSKGALNDGTRELLLRWERVRESWRDGNADAFGRDYLDGLGDEVTRAVRVIEELERLLNRIHADCE